MLIIALLFSINPAPPKGESPQDSDTHPEVAACQTAAQKRIAADKKSKIKFVKVEPKGAGGLIERWEKAFSPTNRKVVATLITTRMDGCDKAGNCREVVIHCGYNYRRLDAFAYQIAGPKK
jgi:hypothetical protein